MGASFIFGIFGGLFVSFYIYRRFYRQRYFKRIGIPGPAPHWLLGNLGSFHHLQAHLQIAEWTKQYGPVFGYYEGPAPVLVISDMKLVNQVFIKQFNDFHGRKMYGFQPDPDNAAHPVDMFFARGSRWKRLRTAVNPTFSSAKLRQMAIIIHKYEDHFVKLIDKCAPNGPFDIYECYKRLTLDTIGECAFGVETNCLTGSDDDKSNPLLDDLKGTFLRSFKIPPMVMVGMIFPEFLPLLRPTEKLIQAVFGQAPIHRLRESCRSIVQVRKDEMKAGRSGRVDLLQLMIDLDDRGEERALLPEEIPAQAMLFMLAGYETSSTALAFTTYLLATHPNVQEKLRTEIIASFPYKVGASSSDIDVDTIHDLEYLDAVIHETLRLYPVAVMVLNRLTMEETQLGGIKIAKGLPVHVDSWTIHRDHETWGPQDTEAFHPERFLPDSSSSNRDQSAFLTFGLGPRICIGKSFGMLEIKLTLVNILRKYRIVKCKETGDKMETHVGATIAPKNGVWIRLERLEDI